MALDIRLACLRDAIRDNWEDLEVEEQDGKLVVRIRKRNQKRRTGQE